MNTAETCLPHFITTGPLEKWQTLHAVVELLSKLYHKRDQIPKLRCFSSHLAVVFASFIGASCEVDNGDVVGAAPTMLQLHWNDQQFYCLLMCDLYQMFDGKSIFIGIVLQKIYARISLWLVWFKCDYYVTTSLPISFTGIGSGIRLPQWQWSNPDEYG